MSTTQETVAPSLRAILDQAAADIDRFKHPDIDEAQQRLHELIKAAGLGGIDRDTISSLDIDSTTIRLTTEWSARGCMNSSDYELPVSILDATDPVQAAAVWGADRKIQEAQNKVKEAERNLGYAQEQLAKAQAHRSTLSQAAAGATA